MNTHFIDQLKIIPRVEFPIGDRIEIYMQQISFLSGVPKRSMATNIQFEALPDDYTSCAPLLRLTMTEAQDFMDRLWDCGVRPTEAKGSAGQLTAVQAHLNDMRQLVFRGGEKSC
jgi:hypothetical protein